MDFVEAIEGVALRVDDPVDVPAVTRDPDDDYIVALAVAAGADFIVSGDEDLLSAASGIPAVSPWTFLQELTG